MIDLYHGTRRPFRKGGLRVLRVLSTSEVLWRLTETADSAQEVR